MSSPHHLSILVECQEAIQEPSEVEEDPEVYGDRDEVSASSNKTVVADLSATAASGMFPFDN